MTRYEHELMNDMQTQTCPIIFMAHSLGGSLVKSVSAPVSDKIDKSSNKLVGLDIL
jgi:hypothetical protein